MADRYSHVPLQHPRDIRIIQLEAAGDAAVPIQIQLDTISLDDHPTWDGDYTALSYSWDSQLPSCEIGCGGYSLLVTANCDAALRELRHASETTRLWIDSICIDQTRDAVQERNTQVALMGEIYKCAGRVVVWLGRIDVRIRSALELVTEIASLAERHSSLGRREVQRQLREKAQELSNNVRHESEDPFNALFRRSWFHRMWTIQEVTLSWVDRIAIRCSNIEIPWRDLVITVDALHAAKYRWGCWKKAMSLQRQLLIYLAGQRYAGVRELLDDNPGDMHNDPLVFYIFSNSRKKQSTDPRDKVFALYGLFKELGVPFPLPDYSQSIEDVYREATISCINYDRNIYILFYAPSARRRPGLPSWVPDLAEDGWDEGDARQALLRSRFTASKGLSATWSFSDEGTGLILAGKIVDTIIFRADPMPSMDTISGELRRVGGESHSETVAEFLRLNHRGYSILKSWVDISQWSDYPTGEPARIALQRAIVNDNPDCNAEAANGNTFDRWYSIMTLGELETASLALRHIGPAGSIPREPQLRERFLRETMRQIPEEQLISHALQGPSGTFHSRAMFFAQKKCLFFTENSYIGTAADPLPVPIEPGDKIAVVRGLEMPLALRPVEGGYRLLTHVYVHGIMYGEAWPQSEEMLEDIILL